MNAEPEESSISPRARARELAVRTFGDARVRRAASLRDLAVCRLKNTVTADGRENASRIRQFRNIAQGERCVIIGNGPSLNRTDLSLLEGETTFGLNRIYLMYDKLGFKPSYHVVVNQLVVEQCASDFEKVECPLFTTRRNEKYFREENRPIFLGNRAGPLFSTDLADGIWEGATVTFVAMQIAYYMGFSKVVLVGVDHTFAAKGPAHKVVESTGADVDHFDPNYFGKGFKWQLPDLDRSEDAYRLAKHVYETSGREILDATVDGKLNIFRKVALAEALA